MGFLKKFFTNVFDDGAHSQPDHSSFDRVSEDQLEEHLTVARYGDFELTDAIRPAYDLKIKPRQGYRHDFYRDEESRTDIPVAMCSASKEVLFDLFMDLLKPLGQTVDVVLETSHDHGYGGHTDLYREHIDMPVLKSILWEFEDLLLNDGCTGIAVLNPRIPQEVQFDEHKLLIVYGRPLEMFEHMIEQRGVDNREEMKFITEAEHVHSSNDQYADQFEDLRRQLGMDGDGDGAEEAYG